MGIFRKLSLLAVFLVCLALPVISRAEDPQVKLYLFWQDGCPHCAAEKAFLADLKKIKPYDSALELHYYDVAGNNDNIDLLKQLSKKMNFSVSSVPVTIIGNQYFIGFDSADGIGSLIKDEIDISLLSSAQPIDPLADLTKPATEQASQAPTKSLSVKAPFLGQLDLRTMSLPALSAVIGLLDGFNPCAMWSLLFLISLLLGMNDRKKMWLLGSAFIVGSAAVYFVFMVAWLNLIIFLGFVLIIRIIIGLTAIGTGAWSLRKFWQDRNGGCEVTGKEERRQIFEKIKRIVYKERLWLSLLGILALSFAVNLVELLCSAGFPAIFTQILALNHLPTWQYYGYIILYLFFYMLDDMIIFIIAMTTLKSVGISTKYGRWSGLIGGILMVIIGLLLIFKYQWLMFG